MLAIFNRASAPSIFAFLAFMTGLALRNLVQAGVFVYFANRKLAVKKSLEAAFPAPAGPSPSFPKPMTLSWNRTAAFSRDILMALAVSIGAMGGVQF
jgi:hypothetical protein